MVLRNWFSVINWIMLWLCNKVKHLFARKREFMLFAVNNLMLPNLIILFCSKFHLSIFNYRMTMQKNVIFLLESGFQTHWDQCTLMRAAMLWKSIRIAWRMGDPIRVICIGGGSHGPAICLCLIRRRSCWQWGISPGHLSVIRFLETMSSHCSVFFQRFDSSLLFCNLTGLLVIGFV